MCLSTGSGAGHTRSILLFRSLYIYDGVGPMDMDRLQATCTHPSRARISDGYLPAIDAGFEGL